MIYYLGLFIATVSSFIWGAAFMFSKMIDNCEKLGCYETKNYIFTMSKKNPRKK